MRLSLRDVTCAARGPKLETTWIRSSTRGFAAAFARRGLLLDPGLFERGLAEIIALQEADILAPQDRGFLGGLDHLGDGLEAEPLGKAHQVPQEDLIVR